MSSARVSERETAAAAVAGQAWMIDEDVILDGLRPQNIGVAIRAADRRHVDELARHLDLAERGLRHRACIRIENIAFEVEAREAGAQAAGHQDAARGLGRVRIGEEAADGADIVRQQRQRVGPQLR